MSKYKEIITHITDRRHIIAALDELGLAHQVARPGQALALNGWGQQAKSAEVVVRKESLAAGLYGDFGWQIDPQTGTYRLVVDDLDQHRPPVTEVIEGVAQRCAFYRLAELAAANGFTIETQDGFDVQRVRLGR